MSDAQDQVPEITPTSNGPYRITNLKTLEGFYGAKTHSTPAEAKFCRCGGSKNKPFCDGSQHLALISAATNLDRALGSGV